MKNIFLAAIGIVCLMASCSKDSTTELQTNPMVGQEVQFSPNQDLNLQTRTVYGDKDETNNLYPIYWVNGDKVLVYGSTCAVKQAEYAVSVGVVNQNWADALNKTGATGVQWGESTTSNFLAIYPSSAATITSDTKATATIRSTQNNVFEPVYSTDGKTIVAWKGHPFASNAAEKTMVDGIMYARTEGARSDADTDDDETVGEVDLRFKPFTTVLKFKFSGFFSQNSDPTIYVQSITVTSPDGSPIAGEFNLEVSDSGENATAKATAGNTTSNTITLNTILAGGSYIPLTEKVPIEFDVFTLPLPDQTISNLWTVKVATNYGEFTYKLTPNTSNTNTALVAGKVHHITIPTLEVLGTAAWDPTKWMTQVPQDVYLSELSVPGAWYCMDDGYQGSIGLGADALTYQSQKTTDTNGNVTAYYTTTSAANGIDDGLENLFYNGIRAFNIDCRVSKKNCNDDERFSWLGAEKAWSDADYPTKAYLACSGTEPAPEIGFSSTQILSGEGIYVLNAMKNLVALAQAHPEEYIVVVFTFAEKYFANSESTGGVFGSINPVFISEMLAEVLNDASISPYLYKDVTSDTTIQDVLGSGKNIIVKINHSNDAFYSGDTYTMVDGIMASFGSMVMSGYNHANTTTLPADYYSTMRTADIYNGKKANDMTYYYHQAQKTEKSTTAAGTTYPSVYDRLNAVTSILSKATNVYDNSVHNALFQLGIGGSIDDNQTNLAIAMNPAVRGMIETKLKEDPSPVGFVLMNYALGTSDDTDGNGLQLVKDIIEMNGKFYLKREGGDIITDGGSGDSSGTTGGDDMGDDQP